MSFHHKLHIFLVFFGGLFSGVQITLIFKCLTIYKRKAFFIFLINCPNMNSVHTWVHSLDIITSSKLSEFLCLGWMLFSKIFEYFGLSCKISYTLKVNGFLAEAVATCLWVLRPKPLSICWLHKELACYEILFQVWGNLNYPSIPRWNAT